MPRVRKNIFDELEQVKNLVRVHFSEEEIHNICPLLSKLGTYHYNKKKNMLLGKHKLLYNSLIENGYNPFTAYRWALLERIPEEIKFQLKNYQISQKKASKVWNKQRRETEGSIQQEIRRLGLQLVRSM
tara:strand:- start:17908 stop:18294 length:387 start_codon:yes stop_codon:yes gene_type:complete